MAQTGWKTVTVSGYTVNKPHRDYYDPVCAFVPTGAGVDRYVSNTDPNRTDSGAGGIGAPWATLGYMVANAQAGDVVHIRGGTYTEKVTISNRGGTNADRITVQAYNGESVTWQSDTSLDDATHSYAALTFDGNFAAYWRLHNIEFVGNKGRGAFQFNDHTNQGAILFDNSSHKIDFYNCTIRNGLHAGAKVWHHGTQNRINWEGCIFYNNGQTINDHHLYSPVDVCVVRGCLFVPPCSGWAIHLFDAGGAGANNNNIIYNNIAIGMPYYGTITNGPTNTFMHNAIYNCGITNSGGGMELYDHNSIATQQCTNNVFLNNVSYKNYNYPTAGYSYDFRRDFVPSRTYAQCANQIDYNLCHQGANDSYINAVFAAYIHNTVLTGAQAPTFFVADDTNKIYDLRLQATSLGYGAQDPATLIPATDFFTGVLSVQPMGIFSANAYDPAITDTPPIADMRQMVLEVLGQDTNSQARLRQVVMEVMMPERDLHSHSSKLLRHK